MTENEPKLIKNGRSLATSLEDIWTHTVTQIDSLFQPQYAVIRKIDECAENEPKLIKMGEKWLKISEQL